MSGPEDLRAEAQAVLALLEPLGQLTPTGAFVSGLMVSRDLDVMLLGGPAFSPDDVVVLLGTAIKIKGMTAFSYADERDEKEAEQRYHLRLTVGEWRVDLSIWLNDDHTGAVEWHEALAERLTGEEREAILAIKKLWHERPEYPGGYDVYTAVLDHGVRTAVDFGAWLRSR
ncbi:hypothetical protein [Actinoplanes sp. NPDC051851]|uniref:hypothetical protein n=1 Tax=Actinoplanes sp. NPDC051851 TaxID=3154753 RepID=UPI003432C0C6